MINTEEFERMECTTCGRSGQLWALIGYADLLCLCCIEEREETNAHEGGL